MLLDLVMYESPEPMIVRIELSPSETSDVSIPKDLNPLTITAEEAIALIEGKRVKDEQRFIKKFEEDPEMEILKGRFGPYISYQKANYRIPKTVTDPTILTLEDCKKIIAEAGEKPAAKKTTRKKKA